MRRLLLYFRRGEVLDVPANKGFDVEIVLELLRQLELRGIHVESIDTSSLSDEQLMSTYLNGIVAPAASKKHRFRQVFGSKRYPGRFFGKGVPALAVYEDGSDYPSDVYPHEQRGRLVTVRDFLEEQAKPVAAPRDALHAAARMDERRTRVGSIGFRVAELIREGRHR